jgi:hypothetical protein
LPGQSAHVDLVLRGGGKLDGRVVDAAGRPVAGAFVTMAAVHGLAERDVRSATDGTFAFAAVPEDVVVSASVGEDDDARGVRTGASVREGGHESVTLVIPDARRPLDVHVEDERGFPLGAAQVSAASVDPADPYRTTVFTDGHGDAVLRGGQGLSLRVEVSAPGHATRAVPIAQDAASTRVVLAAAETIAGLVRESRSGQPVARAEVVLLTDGRVRRTETDGRGAFRFSDVALGRARLRLRADGRVASERDVDVSATATRTHDVGPIDLQDEAAVEGTVLDAAGKPVVGARVARDVVPTFVPVGPRDPSIAVTDGRGRFRLGGLPEGAVSLEAYAPESGRVVVEGVLVSSGRTTGGVTLRLTNDGDPPTPEPLSSGGVAVTLGELAGEGHEVVVVAVAAASEAERAGLAPGDVLVAVDGERVRRMADARARLSGPLSNDVIVLRRRAEVTEALRISRERVRR